MGEGLCCRWPVLISGVERFIDVKISVRETDRSCGNPWNQQDPDNTYASACAFICIRVRSSQDVLSPFNSVPTRESKPNSDVDDGSA